MTPVCDTMGKKFKDEKLSSCRLILHILNIHHRSFSYAIIIPRTKALDV